MAAKHCVDSSALLMNIHDVTPLSNQLLADDCSRPISCNTAICLQAIYAHQHVHVPYVHVKYNTYGISYAWCSMQLV